MKEQQLQAQIIRYIQAKGGYVVKVVQATKAGVPDIICCYKGKFYGIEVKVGYNNASAIQIANIQAINSAGGAGIIAYSLEDVSSVIKDY